MFEVFYEGWFKLGQQVIRCAVEGTQQCSAAGPHHAQRPSTAAIRASSPMPDDTAADCQAQPYYFSVGGGPITESNCPGAGDHTHDGVQMVGAVASAVLGH